MNDSKLIAQTILDQIGGGRVLRLMIGAKDFISLSPDDKSLGGLMFTIPSTLSRPRISKIIIKLNGKDLYDVSFVLIRKKDGVPGAKVVAEVNDVYCDQLKGVIESNTGLVLTMPRFAA